MMPNLFPLLLLTFNIYGQQLDGYSPERSAFVAINSDIKINEKGEKELSINPEWNVQLKTILRSLNYIGTPFLEDGWYKGQAVLEGGIPVEGWMAYDMVRQFVYLTNSTKKDAQEIKPEEFALQGHNFSLYTNEYNNAGKLYYENLNQNPMVLKHYYCKYEYLKTAVGLAYGADQGSKYEGQFHSYEKYYLVPNKTLIQIMDKNKFYNALGSNSKLVKSFVKNEGLDLGKARDIQKLITYLSILLIKP